MATPELAIAKAALSATLFRADPTSLGRPAVEAFFPLVDSAVKQCSRPNVQKCKAWIVNNIVPSTPRSTALGKYLVALSKSLTDDDGQRPSVRRRRLHVLYVVNDILHHVVSRHGNREFEGALGGTLPLLVASAASFDKCSKHKRKLQDLVDLWQEKQYLSPSILAKVRESLTSGTADVQFSATPAPSADIKLSKDAPFVLPSLHGDPSAPWYDLPASTWLPYLTPNSTKSMLPDLIKPIQLAPGPADKTLVAAVKDLLSDVNRMFSPGSDATDLVHVDFNELGERVTLDEITGDVIDGETYYGWSRDFCEKMKDRRRNPRASRHNGGRHSRSRSRSSSFSRGRSRSSSGPAPKRRRHSPTSRSPGASNSRSTSRTRTRSRPRSQGRNPEGRYSRQQSRSRSRSPPAHTFDQYPPPPHPPPPQAWERHQPFPPDRSGFPPVPPTYGNLPPPPPPPAGYQGPWPPPPPPPPPGGMPPNWMPMPGVSNQLPVWPSGAQHSSSHQQQQQHGQFLPPQDHHFGRGNGGGSRGRGGGGGSGRGSWSRGGYH